MSFCSPSYSLETGQAYLFPGGAAGRRDDLIQHPEWMLMRKGNMEHSHEVLGCFLFHHREAPTFLMHTLQVVVFLAEGKENLR